MTRLVRLFATIAVAAMMIGCITPSDPRLDDSDVDGSWSQAGNTAAP